MIYAMVGSFVLSFVLGLVVMALQSRVRKLERYFYTPRTEGAQMQRRAPRG